MLSDFFLVSFALRFAKWIVRSAFRIFVAAVIFGFLVWLLFIKLGYGDVLMEYVSYFLEFLGFVKDTGSQLIR